MFSPLFKSFKKLNKNLGWKIETKRIVVLKPDLSGRACLIWGSLFI